MKGKTSTGVKLGVIALVAILVIVMYNSGVFSTGQPSGPSVPGITGCNLPSAPSL